MNWFSLLFGPNGWGNLLLEGAVVTILLLAPANLNSNYLILYPNSFAPHPDKLLACLGLLGCGRCGHRARLQTVRGGTGLFGWRFPPPVWSNFSARAVLPGNGGYPPPCEW